MSAVEKNKTFRTIQGKVVSDKMDKTIAVEMTTKSPHPIYKKYIKQTTKVLVHDEKNEAKEGDVVMIREVKPIAKNKNWLLLKVVQKAV